MKNFGKLAYKIEYLTSVLEGDFPSLPLAVKLIIMRAIEERLTIDPVRLGKPLQHQLKGYRRLRVGVYRII